MYKRTFIFGYGFFLSAVAGTLLGLFYVAQNFLIDYFWQGSFFQPLRNAIVITFIALVIIFSRKFFGQLPQNFSNVMVEIRQTGTADYRFVLLQMIIPAIILVSGTSLGPEATLMSSTILYGVWISDKLRYIDVHFLSLKKESFLKRVYIILIPHRYLLHKQNIPNHNGVFLTKRFTKITYFLSGVACFAGTLIYFREPSFIIRIGTSQWHTNELNWFIPLLIGSYLLGNVYLQIMIQLRKILQARLYNTIQMVIFGGIAIYIASLIAPDLLFSGQHNFHLFTTAWQNQTPIYLAVMSFAKLLLLTICLNTGWIGGDIFPVIFAATAQGFAIGTIIPNLDHTYVAVVVAIGMDSAILESPMLVGSLMAIFFAPLNLVPIILIATILLMEVRSIQKRYTKYIPTVFDQMQK